MNKQDISEIKKLYNIKNCPINRMAGTYISYENEVITTWEAPFLSLDEETMFKYLSILKMSLSGAKNKTLFELSPEETFKSDLRGLVSSGLSIKADSEIYIKEVNRIKSCYESKSGYVILMFNGVYDVPGKAKDGTTMEDASEETYKWIHMCICPVKTSTPGLAYDSDKETFTHAPLFKMIGKPDVSLMYPAFSYRGEDRDHALLYCKNFTEENDKFTQLYVGDAVSRTPSKQNATIRTVIDRVLGPDKTIRSVIDVERELLVRAEEEAASVDFEEQVISKDDIKDVLAVCDIPDEKIGTVDRIYAEEIGNMTDNDCILNNVVARNGVTIKTEDGITIKTKSISCTDIKEIVTEDGPALLINLQSDKINVNGMEVRIR